MCGEREPRSSPCHGTMMRTEHKRYRAYKSTAEQKCGALFSDIQNDLGLKTGKVATEYKSFAPLESRGLPAWGRDR